MGTTVGHGGTTLYAWGQLISGNYFSLLGARPAVGRLLVRSLRNAERTDTGFDPKGLLYATMYVPRSAGADGVSAKVYPRIQELAARLPGVRRPPLVLMPPLAGCSRGSRFASHE